MFLTSFEKTTSSGWSDDELRTKVIQLFAKPSGEAAVYTFNHLYEKVHPRNASQLALVLAQLVTNGVLRKFVRVQSPRTHDGIADFPSVLDVPAEVHDIYSDTMLDVQPDNLSVMYTRRG
jgi:hypothetical protein